jgi:hydroxyacylglutathione hydrolase
MKKSPVHSMQNISQLYKKCLIYLLFFLTITFNAGCDYFFPPLSGDKIPVEEAYKYLIKHKGESDLILLDVRTKKEFDSLRIENAVNLDFSMTDFPEYTSKFDKEKRYIIVDQNGKKAAMAFELMREQRFGKVHYITGGLDEWQKNNFPLRK